MLALFKPPYGLYMLCAYLGVGFLMLHSCVRHYRMTLAANEGRFTGGHLVTLKASTSLWPGSRVGHVDGHWRNAPRRRC